MLFDKDISVNLTHKEKDSWVQLKSINLKYYERYTQHLHGLVTVTIRGLEIKPRTEVALSLFCCQFTQPLSGLGIGWQNKVK